MHCTKHQFVLLSTKNKQCHFWKKMLQCSFSIFTSGEKSSKMKLVPLKENHKEKETKLKFKIHWHFYIWCLLAHLLFYYTKTTTHCGPLASARVIWKTPSMKWTRNKLQPFKVLKCLLIAKLQDFETILTERSRYGRHKNKWIQFT